MVFETLQIAADSADSTELARFIRYVELQSYRNILRVIEYAIAGKSGCIDREELIKTIEKILVHIEEELASIAMHYSITGDLYDMLSGLDKAKKVNPVART